MPNPQTREDGDLLCISSEAACSAAVILFGKGIDGPQACLTHPRGTESGKVAQVSLIGLPHPLPDCDLMLKQIFASQLRLNVFVGIATTAVNLVVLAVAYPAYLYFLGYETYGVWLILATILGLAQLSNLGINSAIMKLVAEEYGRANTNGIQNYLTTALVILLVSGTILVALIFAFQNQIISVFKLSPQTNAIASRFLPWIAVLSVCTILAQVVNAAVAGLGRMDIANCILSGGKITIVAVSLTLLRLGHGIESLLIGNAASCIFVAGASTIVIRKTINIRLLQAGNLDKKCLKRLLHFGGGVFAGSLIDILLDPFNKLMLSRYAGVSTIPVYEIAFKASMQTRALIQAGLVALVPEVGRIGANMAKYATDRIARINRHAMKLIFLLGTPIYGSIIIILTPLLKFWLREKFVEQLPFAFRIMLFSTFISLLGIPAYYTLLGLGKVRHTLIAHTILAGVSALIALLIVLTRHNISVQTVSWAMLIATAASTLYLNWQNKKTGFKS